MNEKLKDFLNIFAKLGLSSNEYVIFGSSPMAVRGLLEPDDFDVLLKPEIFKKLEKMEGWNKNLALSGQDCLTNDDFLDMEFFEKWGPGDWENEIIFENSELINGFRFASLADVKKYKKILNREKDLEDIAILENLGL